MTAQLELFAPPAPCWVSARSSWDHDAIHAALIAAKAAFVDVRDAMNHQEIRDEMVVDPCGEGIEPFGFVVYRNTDTAPNLLVWVGPRTTFTTAIMDQWSDLFNPEDKPDPLWFIPAFAVAGKPGSFVDREGKPITL